MDAYLSVLERDLAAWRFRAGGPLRFRTIYIGGGTPTVLPPRRWVDLLKILDRYSHGSPEEFTVEANPESLSAEHLRLWQAWGVSRVSVGVQSLDDGILRWLGRIYNGNRARWALAMTVDAGFAVSADLMFGLAGQDLRLWHQDLSNVLSLGVSHLSVYQLTIESQSRWGDSPPEGMADGYGQYRWAQLYLSRCGLDQYEVASFALPGAASRHNLAYWRRENVIGVGPGAWGYLEGFRYANEPDLGRYVAALMEGLSTLAYSERLGGLAAASEAAILALRTVWGIDIHDYGLRFGSEALDRLEAALRAMPENCLRWSGQRVAFSAKGMRVANSLWEMLLWDE